MSFVYAFVLSLMVSLVFFLIIPSRCNRLNSYFPKGVAILLAFLLMKEKAFLFERVEFNHILGLNFLHFSIDPLQALFSIMILVFGMIILFYSDYYFAGKKVGKGFYFNFLFFMLSMVGVIISEKFITFFIFYELTTLTSFFLIGFNHESEEARKSAFQAFFITGVGGLSILMGFLFLQIDFGIDGFQGIQMLKESGVSNHPIIWISSLLIFVGAFTKSAQFPFSFWLPGAMVAPTPISSFLHSATMVKAGVFLLYKTFGLWHSISYLNYLLVGIGLITFTISSFQGVVAKDLKKILAYTTIAALSLMVMSLGLGNYDIFPYFFLFLFSHACYKAPLFLLTGAIDHQFHTRDIDDLKGLYRPTLKVQIISFLAITSFMGLPPTFVFLFKEVLFEAFKGNIIVYGFTAFSLLLNFMIGIKLFNLFILNSILYKNKTQRPLVNDFRYSLGCLFISVLPFISLAFIDNVEGFVNRQMSYFPVLFSSFKISWYHGISIPLMTSLLIYLLGLIFNKKLNGFLLKQVPLMGSLSFLTPQKIYEKVIDLIIPISSKITKIVQNKKLNFYIFVIMTSVFSLIFLIILRLNYFKGINFSLADLTLIQGFIGVFILISATFATVAKSRIVSLIFLDLVGVGVIFSFTLFGALDLAITQLVIELLLLVLFLLTIYKMPPIREYPGKISKLRDIIVSIFGGGVITYTLIKANLIQMAHPLSHFYLDHAYIKAFGKNVVNVIIVDFRALDTIGEITVLLLVSVSIPLIIKKRKRSVK